MTDDVEPEDSVAFGKRSTESDDLYHELVQIIIEQRIEIGRLKTELGAAKLEARTAPLPAAHAERLRKALASITWVDTLEAAQKIAEDGLGG